MMGRPREFETVFEGEFEPLGSVQPVAPAKLPLATKIQVKQVEGRFAALGQVQEMGSTRINAAYAQAGRATETAATQMSRYDTATARLGPEIAQAHQIATRNAAIRQYRIAEETAETIEEQAGTSRDWIASLPSSVFYNPTWQERFQAALQGTHVELLQRPGTKPLSLWEEVKNVATGGDVVARRAWEYDGAEMAARLQQRGQRDEAATLRNQLGTALERLTTLEALIAGASSTSGVADPMAEGETVEGDVPSNELLELVHAREARARERIKEG